MNIQILRYIIIIAFSVTSVFAQDTVSHPYYPLSDGAEWWYDLSNNVNQYKTVGKSVGDTLYYVKSILSAGLVIVNTGWEKLVVRKNGIYWIASKELDDPEYIKNIPEKLVLPLPMKVGYKWEYKDVKYKIIERREQITVSTKTYWDCYLIQKENLKLNFTETRYYARGYGLVFTSVKFLGDNQIIYSVLTSRAP